MFITENTRSFLVRIDKIKKLMLLYCISIFLENKKRESFLKTCIHNGITYTKIEITDQTNEKGYGYQVNINGLKILLLPCNDFDFYKTELESLLGKNITGKIKVISDTKFEVNTLFIKNGNTDLVIEL